MKASPSHEALHQIFGHDGGLFSAVFTAVKTPLPAPKTVTAQPTQFSEIKPLMRQVDGAYTIEDVIGERYAALVEVQREWDDDKPGAWSYYGAFMREKYGLMPFVFVVCNDMATAKRADKTHVIGPNGWSTLTVRPFVVGPHNMPKVIDKQRAAQDLPFAVFSAMIHAKDSEIAAILKPLGMALSETEDVNRAVLTDFLEAGLVDYPAIDTWRDIMATMDLDMWRGPTMRGAISEGLAKGRAEGLTEGELKGEVKALMKVLDARGLAVTEDDRVRIMSCTDMDLLDQWFDQALTATTLAEVFGDK